MNYLDAKWHKDWDNAKADAKAVLHYLENKPEAKGPKVPENEKGLVLGYHGA